MELIFLEINMGLERVIVWRFLFAVLGFYLLFERHRTSQLLKREPDLKAIKRLKERRQKEKEERKTDEESAISMHLEEKNIEKKKAQLTTKTEWRKMLFCKKFGQL